MPNTLLKRVVYSYLENGIRKIIVSKPSFGGYFGRVVGFKTQICSKYKIGKIIP